MDVRIRSVDRRCSLKIKTDTTSPTTSEETTSMLTYQQEQNVPPFI
ncbi:MAG: hypothetical protein Q7J09_00680 [Methanocalculus sp.]|nr:hypothetical protein [Methanocalculus sp.]MDO9538510.1 hypothetical protein [Methanocalculus sp.]